MPGINIAGRWGRGKYVIFTDYCLYVPRNLSRVVVLKLRKDKLKKEVSIVSRGTQKTAII